MDFKYKQLEQELSALSKVFSELGVRLSEVAKEVTASGLTPSEKLIDQISATRASLTGTRFEPICVATRRSLAAMETHTRSPRNRPGK